MVLATIIQIRCVPEIDQDTHGAFTAICPELGLAAMGATELESRINLKMTMQSYCNALRRRGLLERALTESKITWSETPFEQNPEEVVIDVTP